MEDEIVNSLTGFHAFTGNDCISSFYRKGKAAYYKIHGSSEFQSMFAKLGTECNISDALLTKLEEFVRRIYGMRKKDVNEVRFVK